MLQWYRVMRIPTLALLALVGTACSRGSLREDGGGTGVLTFDAGPVDGSPADAVRGFDGPAPTADANCGSTRLKGGHLLPQILVVLDRSVSVDPAQWSGVLSALAANITANNAGNDWGLYTFPADGPACGAGAVSATIDVPLAPENATHVVEHLAVAGTDASGTPTAAAIDRAAAYMLSVRDPNRPQFLLLVTDGAPTCAGTTGALSEDPVQAQADAVATIRTAAVAGVPTIVVAPSAASDVDALNALAVAGAYQRGAIGRLFQDETSIGEMSLVGPTQSCVVLLSTGRPPVPDNVVVTLNDATVPRDRSRLDGWDYADATSSFLWLYGDWCARLRDMQDFQVNVYYGCPAI
jgi:hypothetical protein